MSNMATVCWRNTKFDVPPRTEHLVRKLSLHLKDKMLQKHIFYDWVIWISFHSINQIYEELIVYLSEDKFQNFNFPSKIWKYLESCINTASKICLNVPMCSTQMTYIKMDALRKGHYLKNSGHSHQEHWRIFLLAHTHSQINFSIHKKTQQMQRFPVCFDGKRIVGHMSRWVNL